MNYSGTVAGAIEGVLLGVPSIALSLAVGNYETGMPFWDTPMRYGGEVVRKLLRQDGRKAWCSTSIFPIASPMRSRA